jgi:hypothetical protein
MALLHRKKLSIEEKRFDAYCAITMAAIAGLTFVRE